ncbi:MAG: Fur family transcriptional regulator [Pseudomonadota bacterium]
MSDQDTITIDHLEDELRAEGIRVTRQRVAILSALMNSSDHPTVDELLERARKIDESVSQATVYRTVNVLADRGTVLRNEFDGTSARFELANKPHHDHMIDVDTGEVVEFTSSRIEELQEEIAKELGYDIIHHRLELYGRKRRG